MIGHRLGPDHLPPLTAAGGKFIEMIQLGFLSNKRAAI